MFVDEVLKNGRPQPFLPNSPNSIGLKKSSDMVELCNYSTQANCEKWCLIGTHIPNNQWSSSWNWGFLYGKRPCTGCHCRFFKKITDYKCFDPSHCKKMRLVPLVFGQRQVEGTARRSTKRKSYAILILFGNWWGVSFDPHPFIVSYHVWTKPMQEILKDVALCCLIISSLSQNKSSVFFGNVF